MRMLCELHFNYRALLINVMLYSRTFIRPMTEQVLLSVGDAFAEAHLGELSSAKTMELAISAPQALLRPISYRIVNLAPFDIPVYASSLTPAVIVLNLFQRRRRRLCWPHIPPYSLVFHCHDRSIGAGTLWARETIDNVFPHQDAIG